MAQVWETLVAEKNVWTPSFRRGSAAVCMVMTVMMLGLLGMDMLGGTGKVVLSMFPVYMIAYVLLASLAFAVLSAVFLRRLDGGKELPWPRLGGMLMAMVLVKAYIVYSQYMITWYASIPAEMSFYNAAASSGWSGMFAAALVLQLLLPFLILLFPALRRRPSALGAVCAGGAVWLPAGSMLDVRPRPWAGPVRMEGMASACPALGRDGPDLLFFLPGALSVRRVFPRIMMNRTAAVFFLFSRRPGEYLPVLAGRGFRAGFPVVAGVRLRSGGGGAFAVAGRPPHVRILRHAGIRLGPPVLFSFAAGSRSRWMKPAEWLWHACVALGLATIAAGNGCGVP